MYFICSWRGVAASEVSHLSGYLSIAGAGGMCILNICTFCGPKDTLLLEGGAQDYEYLNKSRREVDGIDDREEWRLLKVRGFA